MLWLYDLWLTEAPAACLCAHGLLFPPNFRPFCSPLFVSVRGAQPGLGQGLSLSFRFLPRPCLSLKWNVSQFTLMGPDSVGSVSLTSSVDVFSGSLPLLN